MNPYAKSVHPLGDDDYAPEGMYIEVNATDAEGVYIQQQSLGMDWGYGEMQLVTQGARYLASNPFEAVKGAGYLGKVVDGVITFPTFTQSNGATYQGELIPKHFHGTGDLFAAVFTGGLLAGKGMEDAATLAARFVEKVISATEESSPFGIAFEPQLPWLWEQI